MGRRVIEDDFAREFGREAAAKLSRRGTGKSRRDSIAPFAGITAHLRTLLNDGAEEGDGNDVKTRLEAVEQTTLRIEKMLQRFCEELDGGMRRSGSVDAGETGTLKDLDKSGTSDMDI